MKAFISYSHQDQKYLDLLLKHLAQVKREELLATWTDHAIEAGGSLNNEIADELNGADIFIALISPDYIASNYCFEKEFKTAQTLHKGGKLRIIPVIVEPCDWHNTPFSELKALPKDGKAVSDWGNVNTAFLNVITGIRNLLKDKNKEIDFLKPQRTTASQSKYRAQKDFDSIEKMDFVTKAFDEVREKLTQNIKEVIEVEGIKAKILEDNSVQFKCILVNKNKIGVETTLSISKSERSSQRRNMMMLSSATHFLQFEISGSNRHDSTRIFELGYDDFHLFWREGNYNQGQQRQENSVAQIVDIMWIDWLHSVGIEF